MGNAEALARRLARYDLAMSKYFTWRMEHLRELADSDGVARVTWHELPSSHNLPEVYRIDEYFYYFTARSERRLLKELGMIDKVDNHGGYGDEYWVDMTRTITPEDFAVLRIKRKHGLLDRELPEFTESLLVQVAELTTRLAAKDREIEDLRRRIAQ